MVSAQISVVVPAFNARNYIAECLESIFAQQGAPNFEVIVVDDGSTDGTAELVEAHFPSVFVLRKPNAGPGSARNFGVLHSQCEVIVFIDADDIMLPGRLANQGAYMLKHPEIGLSFGNQQYENDSKFNSNAARGLAVGYQFERFADLHRRLLTGPNYVPNTSVAVSRRAYLDIGGQPEDIIMQEDFAMHCAIARTWPVATSLQFLTWYRQSHSGHITGDRDKFYDCFVTARGRELRLSRTIVGAKDFERGRVIWEDTAKKLLTKLWIEQGRSAVLAELTRWQDLFSASTSFRWRLLSRIPPTVGLASRWAVRHLRSVMKL